MGNVAVAPIQSSSFFFVRILVCSIQLTPLILFIAFIRSHM